MLDKNTEVPSGLLHQAFVATPLTTDLVALDYAAYMASPDVIRVHSDGRWPVDGFTIEENHKQVAQHQADHEALRAFTFLLLDPDQGESLGCLYLNPLHDYLRRVEADRRTLTRFPAESAMVTFWLRQDHQDTGLAKVVAEAVNAWLLDAWPVKAHLFRLLPTEHASRKAMERLGLSAVTLPLAGEQRPYIWYQPR
jgi:RimJ/RimL family protein N-acetyltransferase